MDNGLPILIVSCRPENRKMLLRVFEGLPIDSYSAPTVEQAKEALRLRSFSVVFCEERLSDGTYIDFLRDVRGLSEDTRFVVMLCTGEWEEYLEALRIGAEEELLGKKIVLAPDIAGNLTTTNSSIIFGDLSHCHMRMSQPTLQRSEQQSVSDITKGESLLIARVRIDASGFFDPSAGNSAPAILSTVTI